MERLIAILLFCYFILFPFGQLTRVPASTIARLAIYFQPPRMAAANLGGLLGQFLTSPEVHLYWIDFILFLLLILWGIWRFGVVKKKYQLPPLAKPIFCFAFICLISLGLASPRLSNREMVVAGLYWIRWLAYAGLYFVIFDLREHSRRGASRILDQGSEFKWLKHKNLLNFLVAIGIMVAIFGLVQYFLWPNLRPLEEFEWDPHYYRVVGTFLDPGFTGIILVLTMILIVESFPPVFHLRGGRLRQVPDGTWLRDHLAGVFPSGHLGGVFGPFSGLITYFALALTYSRASYLAYIVGIGVIAWLRKMPKLFVGAVLIGFLTLLILPQPTGEGGDLGRIYSIEARIKNWQQSLIIARDYPLMGVGFNAYRYAQRDYGFSAAPRTQRGAGDKEEWPVSHSGAGADSSFLFVLATTGIFGLAAYWWIWGKAVVGGFYLPPRRSTAPHSCKLNVASRLPRGRDRSLILASLAAVFIHSFFLNSLFYPWVMAWIWILLATESS